MLRYIVFIFALFIFYLFYSCQCTEHFENVARGKTCNQSSFWSDQGHPSNYAVNGNTNGKFWQTQNCIHTAFTDPSPWWEVNLGRPYPVYTIIVWARSGYIWRMSHRVITVDGVECFRFPQLTNEDPRKQTVHCTQGVLNGTIVRLARDRNTGQSGGHLTINLCEFEVIICNDGYWGITCNKMCGECRDDALCDKVTGNCTSGCRLSVLKPPLCTECIDGRHGENCNKNCSVNCDGTCDKNTGNCHSCRQPGVQLPLCECPDGTFGQNCSENCGENCADVCEKITGECACKVGWKSLNCSDKCEAGSYGDDCSSQCGACSKGISCNHINGSCDQCVKNFALPLCKECADGFHGPNCSQRCSENCASVSCSRDGGHCACKSGWIQPRCRECADGLYGPNCSQRCSENCVNVSCSRDGGHCACKPGWMLPGCRVKCSKWTYGVNCDERCGNCRNATDCLPDSGFCTNGCAEGFTGSRCTEVRSSDSQNRVAEIAGSFVGGFALSALIGIVVVIVRRRQRMATRTAAPEEGEGTSSDETHFGNHNYDNVDQDSGQASNPQENPAFEMVQGSPQAAYDASNYERLEIHEKRKEITNVYTGLT